MNKPKTVEFTLKRIIENLDKIPSRGFEEEKTKLTSDQKKKLMEMASMFHEYGTPMQNAENIVNTSKNLSELCELAETYAVNECGDWFQQEVVKKDMKSMKQRVEEFNKVAKECYARMQQLGVIYEDIGHVLGRYYELNPQAPAMGGAVPSTPNLASQGPGTIKELMPTGRDEDSIPDPLSSLG